jgi:ribosomal protein S24E
MRRYTKNQLAQSTNRILKKKELLMRNVFDGKAKLSGDIVRSDCSDAIFTTLIISALQ